MENEPGDPTYVDPIDEALPDPGVPPTIEPGWWEVIGGAWRWMTDPT
jgi:hypothetical protein